MKYNTAVLTTLAVSMASVHAAPTPEQTPAIFRPSDPFVACVQKKYPKFPKEGTPTQEVLRACFPEYHPQVASEVVSRDSNDDIDSGIQRRDLMPNMPGTDALRGLWDNIQVLGKTMAVDQKSACQDTYGTPTNLHDEFVWVSDVANVAAELCNGAMAKIDATGLTEGGGLGYAAKEILNAHDDQGNYLHNGRKLLLTMSIKFFPPLAIAQESIKDVATGVRNLCQASVLRLMDSRDGCTSNVEYYNSSPSKWINVLAAVGGQVGVFFESSHNNVATVNLGFSEDSN